MRDCSDLFIFFQSFFVLFCFLDIHLLSSHISVKKKKNTECETSQVCLKDLTQLREKKKPTVNIGN